jgi:putative transposase
MTFCVEKRKPVLATDQAWKIGRLTFEKLNQWTILAAVAMPDHIHLLATPMDREASVAEFAKWFKRWFNSAYSKGEVKASQSEQLAWQWQEGAFDRLLRSHESLTGKWEYIRQNPVRAGLVADPDDWPYQLQFDASRG